VSCGVSDIYREVPIRTFLSGVWVNAFVVIAVLLVGLAIGPKTTQAKTVSRTTSQGIRKSTVSYSAVTLPEVAATPESQAVAAKAVSLVGSRYRYGGRTPSGFDCSGLVNYVANSSGVAVPRSASTMYKTLSKTSDLRVGDIIYFGRGSVSHVAIYVGNGQIVHASTPRTGVRVDSLTAMAKALGFRGATRIV
jgi:cell wall-associated NlpC family hydrolase